MRVKNIYGIPVVIAMGIIPLIVRLYSYSNDVLVSYPWFTNENYSSTDLFLAWKAFAVEILLVIILYFIADRLAIHKDKMYWEAPFYCPIVFSAFALLSAILAEHPSLAFKGSFEWFEPVGTIVGYLAICYYAYSFIRYEENLNWLIKVLAVFVGVMMAIGIGQSVGYDINRMNWFKRVILPKEYWSNLDSLEIVRPKGLAYLMFYNENFTSMYYAVLIPVVVSLVIGLKKVYQKAIAAVFLLVSLFVHFHSNSISGWFGIVIGSGIALLIFLSRSKKMMIIGYSVVGICLLLGIGVVIGYRPLREKAAYTLFCEDMKADDAKIKWINTNDDELVFFFKNGEELHSAFQFNEGGSFEPNFSDKDGNTIEWRNYTVGEDTYYIPASEDAKIKYTEVFVKVEQNGEEGLNIATFVVDEQVWPFTDYNPDGNERSYYFYNSVKKLDKFPEKQEYVDLFPSGFFSLRGEIYNHILARLPHHILTGAGANLFIIDFPNDDYLRQVYNHGWGSTMYDVKAHSYYLQTWMENGFIAFLALIIFFGVYIVRGVTIFRRVDFKETISVVGFGFYIGCLSYMIVVLVNDSNPCSSPFFWGALGISFGIDRILSDKIGLERMAVGNGR